MGVMRPEKFERTLVRLLSKNRSALTEPAAATGVIERLDQNFRLRRTSSAALRLLGLTEINLQGQLASDIGLPRAVISRWLSQCRRSEVHGCPVRFEMLHPFAQEERWLTVTICPIGARRFRYYLEESTARHCAEMKLRSEVEQLRLQVNQLSERARELTALSELCQMLQVCSNGGSAFRAAVSATLPVMFEGVTGVLLLSGDPHSAPEPVLSWGGDEGGTTRYTKRITLPLLVLGEPKGMLSLQEQQPGSLYAAKQRLAAIVVDHLALALANLQLREALRLQSVRDPLTGLHNRRYFDEALGSLAECAQKSGEPLAVLILDVDHFKRCNDTYGHDAGDAVLRQVGRCLQRATRSGDIVCRFGGEEFVLLLPGTDLPTAVQRADQIRSQIERLELEYGGWPIAPVTVSVGVAALEQPQTLAQSVLLAADRALYEAKHQGRIRVIAAINPATTLSATRDSAV